VSVKVRIPCVVVRKETTSYGMTGRIVAAKSRKTNKIIFFDDVVTDGRSKIEGNQTLEEAGGKISNV